MTVRTKKLVGTVATAFFMILYVLVAVRLAAAILPPEGRLAHLAYFLVAGFLWTVPVGALILWMQRE